MANNVEYTLTLKDLLTGKLKDAEEQADKLEKKMVNLGDIAKMAGVAIAGMWAASGIKHFIDESAEAYSKVEFTQSQLQAGLESTGGVAGVTYDEMVKSSEKFAHSLKFTKDQVQATQANLLTFTGVGKDLFDQTTQAALDMATRLGGDPQQSIIMLGKALQDPEKGISALRRVGVNTDELSEKFKKVTDVSERQKLILQELNTEFGGSALAAAEADVAFRKEKSIEEAKLKLGELVDKIEEAVMPAMQFMADMVGKVVDGLTSLWNWAGQNKDMLMLVGSMVAGAAIAWGVYTLAINATAVSTGAVTAATWLWQAAQTALNFVMSINPIGLVVVAIGALVAGIIYAWNKFVGFRAAVAGTWAVLKMFGSMVYDLFTGISEIIRGALTLDPKQIQAGLEKTANAFSGAGKKLATAYKEASDEVMASVKKEEPALKPKKDDKAFKPPTAIDYTDTKADKKEGKPKKEVSTAGATGTKSVNINIQIGKLIEQFKIQTTTVSESAGQIKEKVAQTLLGAINDSQIVAGI